MQYSSVTSSSNTKPTTFKILGVLGSFEPLTNRSLANVLETDSFSISKGANADDMMKMSGGATAAAGGLAVAVGAIDYLKLAAIINIIKRKIKLSKQYNRIVVNKPLLFQVTIQRNKLDSDIALFNDISQIDVKDRGNALSRARHFKKTDSLCENRTINCVMKGSKREEFYYQNIYILASKQQ